MRVDHRTGCCVMLQNVLDDRLRHTNLGVVLGAVRLFLHLTEHMPHLHKDVHDRIKGESCTHSHYLSCLSFTCIEDKHVYYGGSLF